MIRLYAAFATLAGAVLAVVLLTVVPRAGGADCTSTASSTSALSSALGSAGIGATLCLADGSYGRLALTVTKAAPGVTVRAQHPGKATIDGATLTGANITLADLNVTDEITIAAGSSGMTISHNKITGGYLGVNLSSDDQQISDTAIVGNQFVGPFGEDAIRANRYHDGPDADPYGLLVEGNEITGVRENGNHSDCLQAVWVGDGLYFRKNYLHDNRCQGFFVKDQASTVSNVVAEDNLFLRNNAPCDGDPTCGQPSIFQLFGPMTGLVVRHNTIWTPGGGSPTTLRDPGWGTITIDSNVIYRPWSDTTAPFGSSYTATNNEAGTRPEGTWPVTGFPVVPSPAFADPAHDDYRTGDGRGVDWAPADQVYGPTADGSIPPLPADPTPPPTTTLPSPDPGAGPPAGGDPDPPADDPADAAPTVDLTSPSAGSFSGRELKLAARARDDHGIHHVEFWVDRTRVARDTKAPYTARYDASSLRTGSHKVTVRAYDGAGQVATDSVTVRIKARARAHSAASSRSRSA